MSSRLISLVRSMFVNKSRTIPGFNKEIHSSNDSNQKIIDLLVSNEPFMICRLGSTELGVLRNYEQVQDASSQSILGRGWSVFLGHEPEWNKVNIDKLCLYSGFFPDEIDPVIRFCNLYHRCLQNCDLIGLWYNYYEDIIVNKYCTNECFYGTLTSLEPYYFHKPWSAYLEGKKVLVIHPFIDSIEKQFHNRRNLFVNPEVLPDFELITIKSVQTLADEQSEFSSWFDALDSMKNKMSNVDFDVLIVGAGAYGLPLAAHAKIIGKQGIHLGGATQILFGIKGSRWDSHPVISNLFNEHWIRPSPSERPKKAEMVENACYW